MYLWHVYEETIEEILKYLDYRVKSYNLWLNQGFREGV